MATILYIDHDELAQKSIQAILGQQYNVVSATDGPTAIQYCAMIQPGLILMDVDLPDIDGYGLIVRLKMFMPQTPILLLTTAQYGEGQVQRLKDTADGLLTKPIDEDELWQKIQLLLPPPAKLPEFVDVPAQVVDQFETQIVALNQANKQLASLNAVSALIGTSLDLEHLTDEILHQIQRTVDFDSATLFLLKGSILEAAASRGFLEHQRGMNIYHKNNQNSAWRVVNNKLPLVINDVTSSNYWEPRPELSRVRSWLGVPLIYKDRVVGVLTLDKNESGAFADVDARYVFTLAYQIAIAVENAQLFEEWENQATRLKLINEVAQEITTILDVNSLFDALARAIYDRLPYDRVAIFEMDNSRTWLILRARYGKFLPSFEVGVYRQSANIGLIGKCIKSGIPLFANDISQVTGIVAVSGIDVQSTAIIPVFVGNRIEAIINIESSTINRFKDQDLWTLSSLASQAATVIENARLYHDVDAYSDKLERIVAARTQRLQAIKKISQVVSQGLNVDASLAFVSRGINQIFTVADSLSDNIKVTIGLLDGSKLIVRMIYGSQHEGVSLLDKELATRKFEHYLPVGQVIGQSKPMILNNYPLEINGETVSQDAEIIDALMMAPLITAGKTIGIIMVESLTPNAFDESDLETLESVAFQVASGIEHALLLRKTRELAIVDERTRLAREMHDGIAQNLAYLLIQVDRCLSIVEEDSKLEQQLEHIGQLLTQNIDELRRNIFDLRPVDLEGKSLFEVLENFVAEFGRRWNLQTTCYIQGKADQVPTEVESTLYRILQETLSNARQHAQCTHITVKLKIDNEQWVTLETIDNGRGFDANLPLQNVDTDKGLGLISMRERAESVGGQLSVESIKAHGTRVFAKLPLVVSTNGR